MDTLVVAVVLLREEDGPGVEVRETEVDFGLVFGRPRSDTRVPIAEGGGLEGCGAGVADLAGDGFPRLPLPLLFEGVDVPDLPDMYSSCWSFLLYSVPGASSKDATCRGGGAWRGAFFFLGPWRAFGTESASEFWPELVAVAVAAALAVFDVADLGVGSARRALNVEMNSTTCGESPSMFVKCSAASALESVAAYSSTCWSPSSGSGSSWKSWSLDIFVWNVVVSNGK
jgi:hypothetical protein